MGGSGRARGAALPAHSEALPPPLATPRPPRVTYRQHQNLTKVRQPGLVWWGAVAVAVKLCHSTSTEASARPCACTWWSVTMRIQYACSYLLYLLSSLVARRTQYRARTILCAGNALVRDRRPPMHRLTAHARPRQPAPTRGLPVVLLRGSCCTRSCCSLQDVTLDLLAAQPCHSHVLDPSAVTVCACRATARRVCCRPSTVDLAGNRGLPGLAGGPSAVPGRHRQRRPPQCDPHRSHGRTAGPAATPAQVSCFAGLCVCAGVGGR
jgi:hypothetical protein